MLFTLKSYKDLLNLIKRKYVFSTDPSFASEVMLLRHDIDFNLSLAHKMASIEHSFEVCTIYLVMVDNPLYDIHSRRSIKLLNEIQSLGHKIGLHYDPLISGKCNFEGQIMKLEDAVESEIILFSRHQPTIYGFDEEINYNNKIDLNLHMTEFKYMSDSCMKPREDFLSTFEKYSKIQLLIHPEFWMLNSKDLLDFGCKIKKFQKYKNRKLIDHMVSIMIETLSNRDELDVKNSKHKFN